MADNHIPVFYEGQDDLIDILATSICSICHNTKSFIDFYILDCGIHSFNKKQLESLKEKFNNFSIKYIPIDLKQFEGLKGWGVGNFVDCYARLLIPEVAPEVDRAIYLDTDVIALDDIKKLWNENLDGYEIAAVADIGYCNEMRKNCLKNLKISKDQIYLNAGVIIIDCKKWRKNKVSDALFKIARDYRQYIETINEDILSLYYNNNNYKLLNNRYNLSDRSNYIAKFFPNISDDYLKEEWKHVVLQHLSPGKVWKISKNNYNGRTLKHFESFWFFAKMTTFIDGMELIFNNNVDSSNYNKSVITIRLFNFIPLIKIKIKGNMKFYKLFGFIPVIKVKIKK